jgi:hypothetical protein
MKTEDQLTTTKPDAAPTGALLPKQAADRLKPREQPIKDDADKFIVGLVQKLSKENESHQRLKAQMRSYIEIMYAGGKQSFGSFRQEGNGFKWYADQTPGLYPNNRFAQVINNLQAQAESSVTKIKVIPTTEDEEKKGGARWADHLVGDIQERYITSQFRQREALYAKFSGEAWRCNRWDKTAGSFEKIPVQNQANDEQLSGSFMCADCGAEGSEEEASEAGGCPDCGKPATIIPGQSVPVTSYSFERKKTGEPVPVSVDPLEMTKERGRGVQESRFILRRRLVHVDDLEEAYLNIEIPKGSDVKSPGLQVQRALDDYNPFGTISSGTSQGVDADYREYWQVWLQPRTYAKYKFDKPCELKCGITIPNDSRLGDIYQEGMYVAGVGDTILDIQSEDGREIWVQYDYYTTTTDGKPVSDAAFLQESIQEAHSIEMEHILRDASGWGGYNKNLFDGDVAPGTPGYYVPMDLPLDGSVKPADVLSQFTGNTLSAHVPAFRQALIEDQQYSIMSFPETAGATSQGGQKTLGGYLQQLEQGTTGQRPMLANRAEADCKSAEQWLRHAQQYMTGERGAKLDGQFGQAGWRWFKASDIPSDFHVTFEPDSFMPQTGTQRRARRAAFIEAVTSIVETLVQLPREHDLYPLLTNFLKGTAQDFGVSIEEDMGQQDTRRAQIKLEKFKAAVEYVGDGGMTVAPDFQIDPATGQPAIEPATNQPVPNPQAGQPIPDPEALNAILNLVPYMPEIDGPGAKTQLDFFRSAVLALDDDAEENPLLVAVICAEMQRLKQADVMKGAEDTAMAIGKQGPAMQLQAAQQGQQQAAQVQGEQANAQREDQRRSEDAAVEAQKREQDFGEKEAQRGHEASETDKQHRHEQSLAGMKQPVA